MSLLAQHAYERASQRPPERPEAGIISKELAGLAGDDEEAQQEAWDHCVQRYAAEEDPTWLMAATYLLTNLVDASRQHVEQGRRRAQRGRRRAEPDRVGGDGEARGDVRSAPPRPGTAPRGR